MTTTRINHTGHNHPNTTSARTACRKATTAPVFHLVAVGKGKMAHAAFIGHDGAVTGTRCGAGLGRGVRKNSPLTVWTSATNDVNCHRCR